MINRLNAIDDVLVTHIARIILSSISDISLLPLGAYRCTIH
jgi:hypothetical protein